MTLFDAPVNVSRLEYQLTRRGLSLPDRIVKRDGTNATFDLSRIARALRACFEALDESPHHSVAEIVGGVANAIAARYEHATPTVEQVQDLVELTLLSHGELEAANAYIAYRDARSRDRGTKVPDHVRQAFADSERYFPTPLQQFMFADKYSRWNWELGRRETWIETVNRNVDYLRWLVREHGSHLPEEVFERIHEGMLTMSVMPSMRSLSQAGPAAQRNSLAIYNCSYMPLIDAKSFGEIMRVSMAGCGVGWSVEREYCEQFPRIRRQTGKQLHIRVEDTTEGWAESVEVGIAHLMAGFNVEYDYSLIRPKGAPLLTKGGRASGPGPLQRVHEFARQVILRRQGAYLTTLDAHDIACVAAGAAVSGGVRRTAAIALFDWDDPLMRACKTGAELERNPHRWNANNSAVWPEDLTQAEVARAMLEMVESQRGEPGIFSRANAIRTKPARRQAARFGTNPCTPYETRILTRDGLRQIGDLAEWGGTFEILNGDGKWAESYAWETGTKPVYEVRLSNGQSIRLTANHVIEVMGKKYPSQDAYTVPTEVEVRDLAPGMKIRPFVNPLQGWDGGVDLDPDQALVYGLLFGDGSARLDSSSAYISTSEPEVWAFIERVLPDAEWSAREKVSTDCRTYRLPGLAAKVRSLGFDFTPLPERQLPEVVYDWSAATVRAFLRGLFTANGGSMPKHSRIDLKSTCLPMLQQVQVLLSALGYSSYITTNKPMEIEWGNGTYVSKESYDLNLQGAGQCWRFQEEIGFLHDHKMQMPEASESDRARRVVTVTSVEYVDTVPVYDFHESITHWGWANGFKIHNCGEINLRPWGLCNLSVAVVRPGDSQLEIARKVELATIIGTIQSLATNFPGMRPEWRQNAEEERLLGVDLLGQADHDLLSEVSDEGKRLRLTLQGLAIEVNQEYASMLGINPAAAITCDKPAGNSSQLLNTASGIHRRWAPYYIRRTRVSAATPLFRVLRDSGVPLRPENGQTADSADTWVASWPVRAPRGVKTRKDLSAVEQCEFWLMNKLYWTEHNPSVTITYQPDEVLALTQWVWEHRHLIGGMAFLPADDAQYEQMPYEEIDAHTYDRLMAEFPHIDYSLLHAYEHSDMTTAAQELACMSGACDV